MLGIRDSKARHRKFRWLPGTLTVLMLYAGATWALAGGICWEECQEGAFGCLHPGRWCDAGWVDCGKCKTLLGGVCVCDPVDEKPPNPDDPNAPEPYDWDSELVDEEEEIKDFDVDREDEDTEQEASRRGGGVPAPGDLYCATLRQSLGLLLRYNRAWAFAPDDRVRLTDTRFCIEAVGYEGGDPDWIEWRFTGFEGTIPSFRPAPLPDYDLGETRIRLDRLPARALLHVPSGIFLAEVFVTAANELFSEAAPVQARIGMRGTWRVNAGRLSLDAASITSITSTDYNGPVPR